ncbi:hypothetical protein WN944_001457 [Citrus x changshan-huyou]|uniref:Glycosyltransferase subfamily 4-like N-terminal domain-containing protein n=1 Tax=Citrus x changshan-huyou TaxID=2935761 RepID=A0AAP0MGF5_9ROSI
MSKGRESKLKDFYVVRQSPPTSTPPSTPGLRISLSEPFQGFKRLQLTSRYSTVLISALFFTSFYLFISPLCHVPEPVFLKGEGKRFIGDLRDAKFSWNKLCFGPTFEKLKLAVFSKTWPVGAAPGGMERHASTLYHALAARGHEIHVFTAPSDRKPHNDVHQGNLRTTSTRYYEVEQITLTRWYEFELMTMWYELEQITSTRCYELELTTSTMCYELEEITSTRCYDLEQITSTKCYELEQITSTRCYELEQITSTVCYELEHITSTVCYELEQITSTMCYELEQITSTRWYELEQITSTR